MVQIQQQDEEEDDDTVFHSSSTSNHPPSTSSQLNHNHTTMNNHSSSSHPTLSTTTATDSPHSSPSSISSDHTFHGFSPINENPSPTSPPPTAPGNPSQAPTPPPPSQAIVSVNRLVREQPEVVTKTEPAGETGYSGRRVLSRARTGKVVRRVGLVLRFCEFVACLVSFSVMAADKNRGWALDSFDRYTEFRYSMSVNVVGFAYSGLQGLDLIHQLTTGKEFGSHLRYAFDFAVDQILAYLLLSASSSAFTRVDDWISNWGNDKFPAMASASVGVSFLAFITFALSSLISGYLLCTHKLT